MRVHLFGNGRMGQAIESLILNRSEFKLVSKKNRTEKYPQIEQKDIVIDFTNSEAMKDHLLWLQGLSKSIVFISGTTGLSWDQKESLKMRSERHVVIWDSNFSLGIYYIKKMLTHRPDPSYFQCLIKETHHEKKKDSPSGTAIDLQQCLQVVQSTAIPIESKREGLQPGRHEVIFQSSTEKLTIIHQAEGAVTFAEGVLIAAQKGQEWDPGFYRFSDCVDKGS